MSEDAAADGLPYDAILVFDFEYHAPAGERPYPWCLVVYDLRSGQRWRLWRDDLLKGCPFDTGPRTLYVGWYFNAEIECFRVLNWPLAQCVIDTHAEFACVFNDGSEQTLKADLLTALTIAGLRGGITKAEKQAGRDPFIAAGPGAIWTPEEQETGLDYCETDVVATAKLFLQLLPHIAATEQRWAQALLRGAYTVAVGVMEDRGIPIDVPFLRRLGADWPVLQRALIADVDSAYHVYIDGHWSDRKFADYLRRERIIWPLHPSFRMKLERETFKEMAGRFPQLEQLADLRHTLSQLRGGTVGIPIGSDMRSRVGLRPFCAKTGRNAPSSTKFPFGLPKWLRSIVVAPPGASLIIADWKGQEIVVGAALSDDPAYMKLAMSKDVHLAFGKTFGLIPKDGTADSHHRERQVSKGISVGLQYGRGAHNLAQALRQTLEKMQLFIERYRKAYPRFTRWMERQTDRASSHRVTFSRLGWRMRVRSDTKGTTLLNFPIQAAGAEMMRLACIEAVRRGLDICAPVHDAIVFQCASGTETETLAQIIDCMNIASRVVLYGYECPIDPKILRSGEHYIDKEGKDFLRRILDLWAPASG